MIIIIIIYSLLMSVIGVFFLQVLLGMTPMITKNIHGKVGNTIQSLDFTFQKFIRKSCIAFANTKRLCKIS